MITCDLCGDQFDPTMLDSHLIEDHEEPVWRKASHSGDTNCVQVLFGDRIVKVRDSKSPGHDRFLVFTHDEWRAFIAGVRDGEFDLEETP